MDAAELEHWQSSLPTDRDELAVMLAHLQAEWMAAQSKMTSAIQLGNGAAIQETVSTLARQIKSIEARLLQ